jgi:hypothetical protein
MFWEPDHRHTSSSFFSARSLDSTKIIVPTSFEKRNQMSVAFFLVPALSVPLLFLFLFACHYIFLSQRQFFFQRRLIVDTLLLLFNALVGLVGVPLSLLNVFANVDGIPLSWEEIDECGKTCAEYKLLHAYVAISAFRFFTWFLEFAVTFLLMLLFLSPAFKRERLLLTGSRYVLHTCVFILSGAVIGVLLASSFPTHAIYGTSILRPIVLQSVILLYVLFSFYGIYSSPVFKIRLSQLILNPRLP